LIRKLGLAGVAGANVEERQARRQVLMAAIDEIRGLRNLDRPEDDETLADLLAHYEQRLEAVNTTSNPTTLVVPDYEQYRRLESQVRAAERSTLLRMRDQNQVTDEVMRKVERELDLLDARQLSNRF
jgi:CPA1 family monovalent cation:H+ antiporter